MNTRIAFMLVAVSTVLGGCVTAPQTPIDYNPNTLNSASSRVGVTMTALPKADTYFPGAGCLLCYATASAANTSLTSHTQTLSHEDLPKLKENVAAVLRGKGMSVIVLPGDINMDSLSTFSGTGPNVAKKDFSPLKQKYGVDKLVVIDVTMLGFVRTYSAYVPTSDPKATFQGSGYIVNLNNNTYEWYMPVNITKSSDKAWDEPPKYPGLTNAYFQTLELAKDSFLKTINK